MPHCSTSAVLLVSVIRVVPTLSIRLFPRVLFFRVVNVQGAGEVDISRGGPHVHCVIAARSLPTPGGDIPIGQRTRRGLRVQRHTDLLSLTWLHLDLGPAHQSFGWLIRAGRQSKVDLCHLGTR